MKINYDEKSKHLAFLLRHDKEYEFLEGGWRKTSNLYNYHGFSPEVLEHIVETDKKGRYEFNEDHTLIRARQGHSIDVDVELEELTPPDVLFHGTATRFLASIQNEGLKPMTRQYVHLSSDKSTAVTVGGRHGTPYVYTIDAKGMLEDGYKFYKSRNNVWLTKEVPVQYLKKS